MAGAVWSLGVTSNVHDELFPEGSVAVIVITVLAAMIVPATGDCV